MGLYVDSLKDNSRYYNLYCSKIFYWLALYAFIFARIYLFISALYPNLGQELSTFHTVIIFHMNLVQ